MTYRKSLNFLITTVLALTVFAAPVEQARASGFPVVDIAALLQSLEDYVTQNSQLAEEIAQYQQMITEYQLMYENLKGYTDMDALKAQFEEAVNLELNQALNDLLGLDPDSANYDEQVAVIYEDYYGTPPDNASINSDYSGVFDTADIAKIQSSYQTDRDLYDRYLDTYKESGNNLEASKQRKLLINKYSDRISTLGPNQEMRALQLMNLQANMQMQQLEQMSIQQNQILLRLEEQERQALDAKLQERKQELERVKKQVNETHNDHSIDSWLM